jgi:beta-phosphoglucomutase-like phosphatase (HAD superfamily)
MAKAFIFDFDGVLVDSESQREVAKKNIYEKLL